MLYLTTRNRTDAYTAFRTLGEGRGPDGGLFVPFQMPRMTDAQILALKEKTFSQNVADILNLFFNARMDSWDVEFCIGRYPTKHIPMSHRIVAAETWHNPDYDFARAVRNLSGRIRGVEDTTGHPTDWAWITVRIAALFGLFSELYRAGSIEPTQKIDIAMPSGDFAAPMAAWYAREMGLPIANIICSCDENDAAWELLHHGELYPTPGMQIPSDLERLICATLGVEETNRFISCMERSQPYLLSDVRLEQLRRGMYAAVISWSRRERIIKNVYLSSTYILDPGSAMAYGGLQDYRAGTADLKTALIVTERSPICSADTVAGAMGISVQELKERTNLT